MNVDRLGCATPLARPQCSLELCATDDVIPPDEHPHDDGFLRGHHRPPAGADKLAPRRVHVGWAPLGGVRHQPRSALRPVDPAHRGADPRFELRRRDRARDDVVGPRVEQRDGRGR
ncbi:hypothetical protein HMPREF0321_0865, partial [Dermacoccus sp. Ellin185]